MSRKTISGAPIVVLVAFGCGFFGSSGALPTHLCFTVTHAAQNRENANSKVRQWAVLIGVENYQHAAPLRHTANDVRELARTLLDRGGFDAECVQEMSDGAAEEGLRPTRANLLAQLPKALAKPAGDDRLIVYFSGHGFRDAHGRLYVAPVDFDPKNPAESGIAVDWLREKLGACKAAFKLLILDACHAGSEKGAFDEVEPSAAVLGEPFRDLAGVVTLASSRADEKSQVWDERKQSLFSYWLIQGLKGNADENGDGVIDIDELYKYVHRAVTRSAKAKFDRTQTPVRIVRSGTPGVPEVLRLRPQPLKTVLRDVAEQLADAMQQKRLAKVGVLEFLNDTPSGEMLGASFGLLGRWCGDQLEHELRDVGEGRFGVVDRRRLLSALEQQHFAINDLGSGAALKRLGQSAGGMPAIVVGTLRSRHGQMVQLQCKLLETMSDEPAGSAGGAAALNESEWAMLGRSAAIRPDDRKPTLALQGLSHEEQIIHRLDEYAERPHPEADPNRFPFRISLVIDDKERQGVVEGNNYYVPVHVGEVYVIRIQYRKNDAYPVSDNVCMRLLVDGLNTMVEHVRTKDHFTEAVAMPISLNDARPWVLDLKASPVYRVPGFVTRTGANGAFERFRVTHAEKSLAARQQFTEQLGLITAAFYATTSARGPLGTEFGGAGKADLTEADVRLGNFLGVVHLRYVDADQLKTAGNR
jgi:uncharacterized caspase-like protein